MLLDFIATNADQFTHFSQLGLDSIAFKIGSFPIRWYSLGYLFGILLGYWLLVRLIRLPGAPLSREHADDMILYATLGIIIGGRLGYIVFYQPSIFLDPVKIFKLWEGGMSLHGGTVGTLIALWLFVRKRGLNYLRVCDYVACCIPFGLFLVRLANFANSELWGRETKVAWAVVFDTDPTAGDIARHPSQLYEAGLEGLLMAAIMWPLFYMTKSRYKPGYLFGVAALVYGVARFAIEFVREPDVQRRFLVDMTGMTAGQLLTLPMLIGGVYLVWSAAGRRQRVESFAGDQSVA